MLYSIIIIWVWDNNFLLLFKQEKPNQNGLKQNIKYNIYKKCKNKIEIYRLRSLGNYQVQLKVDPAAQLTSSRI